MTRAETQAVATAAISEYHAHMYAFLSEFIPRQRLSSAHNYCQQKVGKEMARLSHKDWMIEGD